MTSNFSPSASYFLRRSKTSAQTAFTTLDAPFNVMFFFTIETASSEISTETTSFAPALNALSPNAPVWVNVSRTFFP